MPSILEFVDKYQKEIVIISSIIISFISTLFVNIYWDNISHEISLPEKKIKPLLNILIKTVVLFFTHGAIFVLTALVVPQIFKILNPGFSSVGLTDLFDIVLSSYLLLIFYPIIISILSNIIEFLVRKNSKTKNNIIKVMSLFLAIAASLTFVASNLTLLKQTDYPLQISALKSEIKERIVFTELNLPIDFINNLNENDYIEPVKIISSGNSNTHEEELNKDDFTQNDNETVEVSKPKFIKYNTVFDNLNAMIEENNNENYSLREAYFNRAVELYNNNAYCTSLDLGIIYNFDFIINKNLQSRSKAIELYQEIIEKNNEFSWHAMNNLAIIYFDNFEMKKASELYKLLLQKKEMPQLSERHYSNLKMITTDSYSDMRRDDNNVINDLLFLTEYNSRDIKSTSMLGALCLNIDDVNYYNQAIPYLESMDKYCSSGHPLTKILLALINERMGRESGEIIYSLSLIPDDKFLDIEYLYLTQYYMETNNLEKLAETAIKIKNKNYKVQKAEALAYWYINMVDLGGVVPSIESEIKSLISNVANESRNDNSYVKIANAIMNVDPKDYKTMLVELDNVGIETEHILFNKAICEFNLMNYDRTINLCEDIIKKYPTSKKIDQDYLLLLLADSHCRASKLMTKDKEKKDFHLKQVESIYKKFEERNKNVFNVHKRFLLIMKDAALEMGNEELAKQYGDLYKQEIELLGE